jgi:hypothetical protein
MRDAYTVWLGQAVILQVFAAETWVPVHGVIVGESDEAVRFCVGGGWDVDIFKDMILSVENDVLVF